MSKGNLSTEPYKGVRDFYPKEMAVQSYIFESWSKTAQSFGYEQYSASILEPSNLYKSKGAENAEIINEQTYTFKDRGEREVTLRPEMTPTVARMVAGRSRELRFPLRWFSIPNLFRYERPQKGRLREHWQLNCDMFGINDYTSDVEIITLAYQILIDFGATPEMFTILVNDRQEMTGLYKNIGITDTNIINQITKLNDRKNKISSEDYQINLEIILNNKELVAKVIILSEDKSGSNPITKALNSLGINNVVLDRTIARGFDYYTGTIFEILDNHPENNRAMIGGGRYDNLTGMFNNAPITGVGFGIGDVTMRDFLESHQLLPTTVLNNSATIVVIPTDEKLNLEAQKIAHAIRTRGISVATDIGSKKIGKKIADAVESDSTYTLVVGTDELTSGNYTLKNLALKTEENGSLELLITHLITNNK
jgi:histidyl-tRNA synthetase